MKVAMIVTGFPCREDPHLGIFNQNAAEALGKHVKLVVIHLRSWKINRVPLVISKFPGYQLITISILQIPRARRLNYILYKLLAWPLIRSWLKASDLVHCVGADFSGVLGSFWAKRAGIHNVVQITGSDINIHLPKIRHHREISGWQNNVQGVACNSHALKSSFLSIYPQAKNVHTVYRGVDLERFHPDCPPLGPLKTRKPIRFIFMGGFPSDPRLTFGSNTKGGETLLRVWKLLEPMLGPYDVSLGIAGPNSSIEKIKGWHSQCMFPERVLLIGQIKPEEVSGYLCSSDVVLIPSLEEGLPNVAMEASACGKAVIASHAGGLPEVVRHESTGLLIPLGDESAWKEAILWAAQNHLPVLRMGHQARKHVVNNFNSQSYPQHMVDLYRAALKEPLD